MSNLVSEYVSHKGFPWVSPKFHWVSLLRSVEGFIWTLLSASVDMNSNGTVLPMVNMRRWSYVPSLEFRLCLVREKLDFECYKAKQNLTDLVRTKLRKCSIYFNPTTPEAVYWVPNNWDRWNPPYWVDLRNSGGAKKSDNANARTNLRLPLTRYTKHVP